MYYPEPKIPTERHRHLIDIAVHVAAIGIVRWQQKTELRESEARSSALAERLQIGQIAAGMMVLEWHIPDDHVDWGDAEERLRGPRPASGNYPVYKDQVHPDDLQEFLRMRTRGMTSTESQTGEYRFIRTDGQMRWLRSHHKAISEPSGEIRRMLFAIYDITSLKQGEESRRELEAQLRQAQKMEALGTLAGGIAHDFNNILAAIQGNVELARMVIPRDHPAQTGLGDIEESAQRASHLVKQILSFSRGQPQALQVIRLQDVMEDVARLLRSTTPARIELSVRMEPDTPCVLADTTQIHQVMMNLGTNAMHAIGEQTGRIEFSLFPTGACANAGDGKRDPGMSVAFCVSDTGAGMDASTMERIFDPFFTTKAPGKGTGLGLSVVSGIVKSHNGSISVRSKPGKGSRFCVTLPAAGADAKLAAPMPPDQRHPLKSGAGERILVVDD